MLRLKIEKEIHVLFRSVSVVSTVLPAALDFELDRTADSLILTVWRSHVHFQTPNFKISKTVIVP